MNYSNFQVLSALEPLAYLFGALIFAILFVYFRNFLKDNGGKF
jgi:hypothetical protein